MKIRNGFVSNSSSSSFFMGVPKNSTKDQIEIILKNKIGLPEHSLIKTFGDAIVKAIVRSIKKISTEDILTNSYKEGDYYDQLAKHLLELNMDAYEGSFSSESGYAIEILLYETHFNFEDNELIFEYH
jgi:hypothetical protein